MKYLYIDLDSFNSWQSDMLPNEDEDKLIKKGKLNVFKTGEIGYEEYDPDGQWLQVSSI